MTRKMDSVVADAICRERQLKTWCEPKDGAFGWCAECQSMARRIARALSRAGWLKEGRR